MLDPAQKLNNDYESKGAVAPDKSAEENFCQYYQENYAHLDAHLYFNTLLHGLLN
jgi:hypothetical protein